MVEALAWFCSIPELLPALDCILFGFFLGTDTVSNLLIGSSILSFLDRFHPH